MPKRTTDSAELKAYKEACKQSVNHLLTPLTLLLKANRVRRVTIAYAGGGDSGSIDEIGFVVKGRPDDVLDCEAVGMTREHQEKLEQMIYDALEVRGWEVNNEGSHGTMVWDVERDMFMHEHAYHKYGGCTVDHDCDKDEDNCESELEDDGGYSHTGVDDLVGRIKV